MSEEQPAQPSTPVFRLQKLYLKDLSFESPNAPGIFLHKGEPKVEVNLTTKHKALGDDHWDVTLSITATVTSGDKTMFILEIEHGAVFLLKNIPDQHREPILAVECPTIMFPFTRQIISQISVDGGFMPFLMEPVNFLALYENAKKNREKTN